MNPWRKRKRRKLYRAKLQAAKRYRVLFTLSDGRQVITGMDPNLAAILFKPIQLATGTQLDEWARMQGITGPLSTEQKADLQTYYDHVRMLQHADDTTHCRRCWQRLEPNECVCYG